LKNIKNITSIEQLSKYDKIIREHALILIKDKNIASELVQEMYLNIDKYLKKYPNKIIDGGLVSVSLRNLHRNHLQFEVNRYDRGGADYEVSFPDLPDEYETIYEDKMKMEQLYEEMDKKLNNLTWYSKKVLEYSQTMCISELSRKSGISYISLIYDLNKTKEKLGIKNEKRKK
jgi:hypothetical protein